MISAKQSPPQNTRFWTGGRIALSSVTLALIMFAASSCSQPAEERAAGARNEAAPKANPSVSIKSAPADRPATAPAAAALQPLSPSALETEVKGLDGKSFRLSDYAGKVIVLDLWATWCGPCRYEIPHLVEISKEYKASGVEVIGLDIDTRETPEIVRGFVKEFSVNYRIGWAESDLAFDLMRGNGSIPQTLVITRDGRVLEHFIGFNPQRTPSKMREAIEQALKGAGGAGS